MTITFPCETCGHQFEVDARFAGKKGRCKKCGTVVIIPAPRTEPEPARSQRTLGASGSNTASAGQRSPNPAQPAVRSASPVRPFFAEIDDDDEDVIYAEVAEPSAPTPVVCRNPATRPVTRTPAPIPATPAPPRSPEPEAALPGPAPVPVPVKKKKKKKRRDESIASMILSRIPTWSWFAAAGGMFVLFLLGMVSRLCAAFFLAILYFLGFGLSIVGGLGALATAFSESAVCGVLLLVMPFYALYYLVTRWQDMRRWFLCSFSGNLLIILGAIFLPAYVAAHRAADAARMRNAVAQNRVADAGASSGFGFVNPSPRSSPPETGLIGESDGDSGIPNPPTPTPAPAQAAPERSSESTPEATPQPPSQPQPDSSVALADPAPDTATEPAAPAEISLASNQVGLVVTGLSNKEAQEYFGQKLGEVVKSVSPSFRISTRSRGGSLLITVTPMREPRALADRIDFGKVTRIEGRIIYVQASSDLVQGERPPDTDFAAQAVYDLKSPVLQRRKEALGRLMRTPPQDEKERILVSKAIEPMLKESDGFSRGDAAKALAIWGGPENTPALSDALHDPDFGVRWAVLDTMAAIHDPGAADAVAAVLRTERGKASVALKAMGPKAEPAVLKCLKDPDDGVREEACRILKVIGTEKSVATLEEVIRRANGQGGVASAARDALEGMESLPAEKRRPPDHEFVAQAIYDLKSPFVQRNRDALGRLSRVPVDGAHRKEIARLIEPYLRNPDGGVRSDALRALAMWGGSENTRALLGCLRDADFGVRMTAFDTVAHISDPAAAEAVASFLQTDRGKAAETLRKMGPVAERTVIKYLQHPDQGIREEACRILQAIGSDLCKPALMALIEATNGDGGDGRAAATALQALGGPLNSARRKSRR